MKTRSVWITKRGAAGCLALVPVWTMACSALDAGEGEKVSRDARQSISAGQETGDHPEVGRLLVSTGTGVGFCTGTMVSCNAVLTAGHCVPPDGQGDFEIEGAGSFEILDAWQFGNGAPVNGSFMRGVINDLGLVRVEQMPSWIAPAEIAEDSAQEGSTVTTLGYGCDDRFNAQGGGAKRKRDWSYSMSCVTDTGIICQGDSGGPTFGPAGVVGVASTIKDEYQGCGPESAVHLWDLWGLPWNPEFRSQAMDKINEWIPYCDHC